MSLFSAVQGLMISTSAAESFSLYKNVSKSKMYAELETRLMSSENVVGRGNNFQIHSVLVNFTLLFLKVVYANTFFFNWNLTRLCIFYDAVTFQNIIHSFFFSNIYKI